MSEAASIMGREARRSLGAQFVAAREKRGLSIEQVESETRIRAQRLREIERDDYSQFSHPSYARMYLIDYAKYLGLPISRIRRLLPEAGVCGGDGYQYLQESVCDYMRTNLSSPRRRKRVLPKLITASLILLFSLGGFKLWTTWRDIERLGLNRIGGGDEPVLTDSSNQNTVPATTAVPDPSDSAGTKPTENKAPESEAPLLSPGTSESESALLVGADLDR